MIRCLIETTAECAICGEVACERDLAYAEADDADPAEGVLEGDIVCRDCAGGAWPYDGGSVVYRCEHVAGVRR